MTQSRAVGAPGLFAESSFNRTAATILIVAVAWAEADAVLGGGDTVVRTAAAAAIKSMGITANALAREW
jgi:hypothetical protein